VTLLILTLVCWLPPVRHAVSADKAVLLADLDGDGAPEIVTSGNQVDQGSAFSLLPNRGDGTFAGERLVAAGFGERLEDAGDLDRDGVPDLVSTRTTATRATARSNGSS
jgi:hypothetical protein